MRILVACEESQAITIAFRNHGHTAFSCDLLPCSGGHPEWHLYGDFRKFIFQSWDMLIAHPPCTFLCNSGVRWLKGNPERYEKMLEAAQFFKMMLSFSIPYICVENPIPHKHAQLPKYSQLIQPWQFGHGEKKATCLWLKGLPVLTPTDIVSGREQRLWKLPPSAERQKLRSKTYPGIAEAMASQWGLFSKFRG